METPMVMAKRSAHVVIGAKTEKLCTFAHLSLEEAAGRLKSPLRHDPSMRSQEKVH
ncbi:BnaC01g35120D [Brassica napus]|uniref:BnaC01g35120D protein n=1 Tax=Brassica napus TaxID=3708 RepID=A0A078GT82_BRANA|nr:BnaC01g35120D [Brassica napus]